MPSLKTSDVTLSINEPPSIISLDSATVTANHRGTILQSLSVVKSWWLSSPLINSLISFLIVTIVISGAIVTLIIINAITFNGDAGRKQSWLEINFQILNAIFTLSAVVDQPKRFIGFYYGACIQQLSHHIHRNRFHLLESGKCGDHERMQQFIQKLLQRFPWYESQLHPPLPNQSKENTNVDITPFLVAMALWNISGLAQYGITYVMWGFASPDRPPWAVPLCLPISFLSNIAVVVYMLWCERQQLNRHNRINVISTQSTTSTE